MCVNERSLSSFVLPLYLEGNAIVKKKKKIGEVNLITWIILGLVHTKVLAR